MTLNEKALFDYMYCPLYFYSKYALKVPLDNTNQMRACVLGVIKFFYTGLLNGQMRSYKQLQTKWDTLAADAGLDKAQLINGWGKVVNIIEWSKQNKIIVGDVNCKYSFSSASHTIDGQIDFILVHPNKEIEILYFDLGEKRLNPLEEHKRIKHALDYFGFEKVYNQKPNRVKIYQPKYSEEIVLNLIKSDERRLISVIQNIGESITQKLYIPREGFMCSSCLAKSYCRHFYNQ